MTIHTTQNFQIAYCDLDTALTDLATASQQAAQSIDDALTRGGVAAPNASDLTAVAGRVTSLETSRTTDEGRLTSLETSRTTDEGRLTTLETVNVAKLMGTTTVSIPTGANTLVPLNTTSVAKGVTVDQTGAPGRVKITRAGWYQLSGSVTFASTATGTTGTRHIAMIALNGTTIPEAQSTQWPSVISVAHAIPVASDLVALNVNDYVELWARQETTVARNVDRTQSFLAVRRVCDL